MEIESSIVAAQNALTVNPALREPQRSGPPRDQTQQRAATEYPPEQVVVRQAKPENYAQADKFREQQYEQRGYGRSSQAISAYQSMVNDQKRQEIQQLFGVDTYV